MQNCVSCSFAKVKRVQDLRFIANDIASNAIQEIQATKQTANNKDKKKS